MTSAGKKASLPWRGNTPDQKESITNFYAWLDGIADQVYQMYPWWPCLLVNRAKPHACKAGCCHHSAFLVSEIEWNEIWAVLRGWPKKDLELAVDRARDIVQDYVKERSERGMKLVDICLEIATAPVVCPLLDLKTSQCRIYDQRPIICHAFGSFLDSKHKIAFYSDTVGRAIEQKRAENPDLKLTLPDFDIVRQEMAKVISGRAAPLFVWICLAAGDFQVP